MSSPRQKNLNKLAEVAGILRDRDLAKVEKIVSHMNRLQGDIKRLREERHLRASDQTLDPARLSGAEVAWHAWIDGQLHRSQSQLAALRVTHEAALDQARQGFGRAEVLAQLTKDR